jgi:hypothetical protein
VTAHARAGLRPAARTLAQILGCALLALACAATSAAATAAAMPRISVHGDRLYAGSRPWRAWGMNWGAGSHEPVIAYFDNPTAKNLATLGSELRTARKMGANTMRIYLQLGQVMATPTQPRQRTLTALQRLLGLAQQNGVYLDITGDLVWQPARAPAWYAPMPVQARWRVQARFWTAVARTASSSPAVLCYELTSEPIVSPTPGYYYSDMGGYYFQQSIATAPASHARAIARAWTRPLADAVRSQDDRPVTIGLLPNTTGPFSPGNIGDLLDMLTVHEYPSTRQAPAAVSIIRSFAASHKPVLLGETFILNDDTATQDAFLTGAAPHLAGALEFFDGRSPANTHIHTTYDAIYQASLRQFQTLRRQLL